MGGCSERTVAVYRWWLDRFRARMDNDSSGVDAAVVTGFLAALRERGVAASTLHQAYRTLKTFMRWLLVTGAIGHRQVVINSRSVSDAIGRIWLVLAGTWLGMLALAASPRGYNPSAQFVLCGLVNLILVVINLRSLMV